MTASEPWLHWHDRLHRQLLHKPIKILPRGTTLLLENPADRTRWPCWDCCAISENTTTGPSLAWRPWLASRISSNRGSSRPRWCSMRDLPFAGEPQHSRNHRRRGGSSASGNYISELNIITIQRNEPDVRIQQILHGSPPTPPATVPKVFLMQISRGIDLAGLGSLRLRIAGQRQQSPQAGATSTRLHAA